MTSSVRNVPVLSRERVLDWVEVNDLFEEVELRIASLIMGKVGEGGIAPGMHLSVNIYREGCDFAHGQDIIETTDIPMMMAAFTRYDMR
jgi:hypothetical protein